MARWRSAREFVIGEDVVKAIEVVEAQAAERAALIGDLLGFKKKSAPPMDEKDSIERIVPRTPASKKTGPRIDGVRQDAAPAKRARLL
jgi:hypothetical protein